MKFYNTLTRKLEEFKPVKPPDVSMYTCGMTVYDHTTVGHMRTYVNTDFLRRALEYFGYKVNMVENVTDVGHLTSDSDIGEDKLQKKATLERKTAWDIAKLYEEEFFKTMSSLNVLRPTIVTRATENIKEMINLVKDLEKKGFTYIIPNDGVYFDTSKFPEYGKIAKIIAEDLKAGARVEMVESKRNPTDFALWKFSPEDEKRDMEWESPWAKRGFPGWHIECSVMSMRFLTPAFEDGSYHPEKFETIDLHTGGEDHLMIHHPNEIAQTEASTGKQFVRHWFHNRFLMIDGQKMSKSKGNFYTLKDIEEKGFTPMAVRYLFAITHYRQRLNFTWESLDGAQTALNRLYEIVDKCHCEEPFDSARGKLRDEAIPRSPRGEAPRDDKSGNKSLAMAKWQKKFTDAIENDLNMPQALAVVWEMAKSDLDDAEKYKLLLDWDRVLGFNLEQSKVNEETPSEIKKLADERNKLRKEGKWEEADKIRKKIEELGWIIEDTGAGYTFKSIKY